MVDTLVPEHEMAIRKEDWSAIEEKIADQVRPLAEAVRALRPSGWRKAFHLLREWAVLATTAAIIVALFGLVLTQWNAANTRLATEAAFRAETTEKLRGMDKEFLALRALLSANQPDRRQNQLAAKRLLADARQGIEQLPQDVVDQAGTSFIQAARKDPNAWGVALDFVSYRTLLNLPEMPTGKIGPLPAGKTWVYDLPWIGDNKPQMLFTNKLGVPAEQAARLELIGEDQNKGLSEGPGLIIVTGGAVNLDSHYVRQVIFQGAEVHYGSKSMILENVVFINCKFVLENDDRGREFAQEVLGRPHVSWRA
jgi:hypothetical protein